MEQLLKERFGMSWELICDQNQLILKLLGQPGSVVFDHLEPVFMQTGQQQVLGCEWWPVEHPWQSVLGASHLPAPSRRPLRQPLIELDEEAVTCHYDILSLAFWTMNRLEEVGAISLDKHQRFQAGQSHAVQHEYLDRPLVDEWLHLLGQIIQVQWPQIELKKHRFQLLLSHDVDRPSRYGFRSLKGLVRAVGGDVLRQGDIRSLWIAPWVRLNTKQQLHPFDTFNTFNWIMEQSERAGVKSTFNFICDTKFGPYEPDYNLDHPAIRHLIREIYQRGHLIGLHPSYESYLKPQKICDEFQRLMRVCEEEGVEQSLWGGRMHYLQWSQPETISAWDDAGLDYDSTLGFAERAGFRCGTCFGYRVYDTKKELTLGVIEKPLIAMEASVLSQKYMGVEDLEKAMKIFDSLKLKCKKVGGEFGLLWHNSELTTPSLKALYSKAIQ